MENKLNLILKYLKEQVFLKNISNLSFNKTKEEFLRFYGMHDIATSFVALKYFQANFSLHPIGKDLRNQNILIKNEILDYFAERILEKSYLCFCFDVKSKSKIEHFGWVNESAILNYRKFAEFCCIPIYLIFSLIEKDKSSKYFGYCHIFDNPFSFTTSWDKNNVLIFNWKKGLPFLNL